MTSTQLTLPGPGHGLRRQRCRTFPQRLSSIDRVVDEDIASVVFSAMGDESKNDDVIEGPTYTRSNSRRRITFPAQVRLLSAVQQQENGELLRLLAQHGPRLDINAANNSGMTLLQQAVFNRNLDTVKILLCAGADVSVQDINGFTPLHTASYYGFRQAVSLLVVFGSDMFQMTYCGNMAVDLAKDNATIEMLTMEMRKHLQNRIFMENYGFIFRGIALWERFLVWSKAFVKNSATSMWNAAVAYYIQLMKDRAVDEVNGTLNKSESDDNQNYGNLESGERLVVKAQGKDRNSDKGRNGEEENSGSSSTRVQFGIGKPA